MSVLSPTDRAVLWRTVVTSGPHERSSLLRVLALEMLDSMGRRLDLHTGSEPEVIQTVELLDASGRLDRDELREAFETADEDDERAQAFAALLADHLGQLADADRLAGGARLAAVHLAGAWQGLVLDARRDQPEWLTAPQVAARYGVTPQAVYKWIKAGRVRAAQTPGGSWRLPADQFSRADTRRLTKIKARLAEHAGDTASVPDEALADEIVARRRS